MLRSKEERFRRARKVAATATAEKGSSAPSKVFKTEETIIRRRNPKLHQRSLQLGQNAASKIPKPPKPSGALPRAEVARHRRHGNHPLLRAARTLPVKKLQQETEGGAPPSPIGDDDDSYEPRKPRTPSAKPPAAQNTASNPEAAEAIRALPKDGGDVSPKAPKSPTVRRPKPAKAEKQI